ncbi:MAG: M48 family metallopeptidase, partial [Arenicella sp.]
PQHKREYINGETWLLFGQHITLKIDSAHTSSTQFIAETQELRITVGSRVRNTQQFIKKKVETWYKEIATEYLNTTLPTLAEAMNVQYQSINIRDYKARWGSCSASANLSFNWRIFMAPAPVIDSVIVHELAHITHFNHSKKFWDLVYLHCPDYQKQHAWLKENQYLLQA